MATATATNFLLLKPINLKWNNKYPIIQQYSMKNSFIPLKKINSNFKALNPSVKTGLNSKEINPFEILAKSLRKPVAAGALFVGLLFFMYDPNSVWAASGGRMGGSNFSSSSSSSSSRSSSSSVRIRSCKDGEIETMLIILATMSIIVWLLTDDTNNTVLKLQVGLSGLRSCSLKKDLNRIAEIADTSTSEGLHNLLTETILALLMYHDHRIYHRIYAHSSVDVKANAVEGEERFKELSIEELEKFDEETFVNLNNIKKKKKRSTKLRTSSIGISNEYIVVTILVSAKGGHKHNDLPCINNSKDLKEALLKLATMTIHHSRKILAVEVLWTPQDEDDKLSEKEFLEDYPLLKPLL